MGYTNPQHKLLWTRKWRKNWSDEYRALEAKKCKERNTRRKLRSYGVFDKTFDQLLAEQNGQCACCGDSPAPDISPAKYWHIDHDHSNQAYRGILCYRCNIAIGMIDESIFRAERIISYLKRH